MRSLRSTASTPMVTPVCCCPRVGPTHEWGGRMATSELDKMLAGELYDPGDAELGAMRIKARELCAELNASGEADTERRRAILTDLFKSGGDSVLMQPPFYCDYGSNISLGERVFFNFNCG